jgi:hypothetical protein
MLRQDRKELLDDVGFVWKIDTADAKQSLRQRKWDDMFAHLVEYKRLHDHVNVPQNYKGECDNDNGDGDGEFLFLGEWVSHQRKQHRRGLLDPRRVERLLEIGFTWGTDFDHRWNEKYEQLVAFHQTNGHCNVPAGERAPEYHRLLARWVQKQRLCQNTLPLERKAKLESLGFNFKVTKRKRNKAKNCKQDGGVMEMEPPTNVDDGAGLASDDEPIQVTKRKRKAKNCKGDGVTEMEPPNVDGAGLNSDEQIQVTQQDKEL